MTWWGSWALVLGTEFLSGAPVGPRRHEVEIRGMAFHPAELTVAVGDTVVWINRDIVPHNATLPPALGTSILAQGEQGVLIPERRGELRYNCTLHPGMRARLVVR